MTRFRLPLVVQFLVFLIPVNIYVIGDWLGAGVQWILVRYQQTYLGTSIIPVTKDISYILNGTISGRTAISFAAGDIGTLLLITATILVILAYIRKDASLIKKSSVITIAGGMMFVISGIVQYGIWFKSTAGFVIPVGIPLILIIGWWMYQNDLQPEGGRDDHGEENTPETG